MANTMANDMPLFVNEKCPSWKMIFVVEGCLNLVISYAATMTTSIENIFTDGFFIFIGIFTNHQCERLVKISELHWRHLRTTCLNIYTNDFLIETTTINRFTLMAFLRMPPV